MCCIPLDVTCRCFWMWGNDGQELLGLLQQLCLDSLAHWKLVAVPAGVFGARLPHVSGPFLVNNINLDYLVVSNLKRMSHFLLLELDLCISHRGCKSALATQAAATFSRPDLVSFIATVSDWVTCLHTTSLETATGLEFSIPWSSHHTHGRMWLLDRKPGSRANSQHPGEVFP